MGSLAQGTVRGVAISTGDRHGIRSSPRLFEQELMRGPRRGERRRLIALEEDAPALGGGKQRELRDRTMWPPRGVPGQVREALNEPLDRGAVEEVGAVLGAKGRLASDLGRARHLEEEVELGRARGDREGAHAQPVTLDRIDRSEPRLVHDQHRLEERAPAGVPGGLEIRDEHVEREVLVRDG
ncbi:MAG TPA: hypothetical protein VK698_12245, partial [Kofleriaceae bacterium]|nr:hypothetical protein [Kofleriaceae bacterium]